MTTYVNPTIFLLWNFTKFQTDLGLRKVNKKMWPFVKPTEFLIKSNRVLFNISTQKWKANNFCKYSFEVLEFFDLMFDVIFTWLLLFDDYKHLTYTKYDWLIECNAFVWIKQDGSSLTASYNIYDLHPFCFYFLRTFYWCLFTFIWVSANFECGSDFAHNTSFN